jgi:hypothetical protein
VAAQDVDLDARLTFYGDNTEFSNDFREGQTTLGTFAQLFVEARLNDRIALRGGVFGNQAFGSDRGFDEVRPVLVLVVGGPRSRVILGTLETMRSLDGVGPDRTGPHGLLPPMQRETLAFERPWEAGMQWTVDAQRLTQDAWVNWQKINTREEREVFDAGLSTRVRLRPALALRTDAHVVHHGGQLSNTGVVADSSSAAIGVEAGGPAGTLDRVSVEGFALYSRYVPDREQPERSRTGFGGFLRASAELAGWRLHGIVWRSSDFIAEEGDRNYHSLRRDGTEFRALRDYAEAGLTRTFRLAPAAFVEASARWHLVERRDEYSFRILAVAGVRVPLTR